MAAACRFIEKQYNSHNRFDFFPRATEKFSNGSAIETARSLWAFLLPEACSFKAISMSPFYKVFIIIFQPSMSISLLTYHFMVYLLPSAKIQLQLHGISHTEALTLVHLILELTYFVEQQHQTQGNYRVGRKYLSTLQRSNLIFKSDTRSSQSRPYEPRPFESLPSSDSPSSKSHHHFRNHAGSKSEIRFLFGFLFSESFYSQKWALI